MGIKNNILDFISDNIDSLNKKDLVFLESINVLKTVSKGEEYEL